MVKEKKMSAGKVEKPYSNKMSHKERAFIAAANRNDRPDVKGRMKSAREASNLHRERTGRGLKLSEDIVMSGNLGEEEESPMRVLQRRHWNPMYNPVPIPITQTELMQHLHDNPAIANNILALIEGAQGLRPKEQVDPVEPQMAMEMNIKSQNQLWPKYANATTGSKHVIAIRDPIMASSPMLNNEPNMAAPPMEQHPKRRHTSFGQDGTLYEMPGYNRNTGPQFMGRSSSTPGTLTPCAPFEHDSMIQNARPQSQMNPMHQNHMLRSPEPQHHMNQVHQSPIGWFEKSQAPSQERSLLDMSYTSHFLPSQTSTNAVENHHYNQFAQPSTDDKFFADMIDFNGGGR
ncbi:hypothetical protein H4I96_02944 [Botrytis cinerea]